MKEGRRMRLILENSEFYDARVLKISTTCLYFGANLDIYYKIYHQKSLNESPKVFLLLCTNPTVASL